jgi:hypothetical protein
MVSASKAKVKRQKAKEGKTASAPRVFVEGSRVVAKAASLPE